MIHCTSELFIKIFLTVLKYYIYTYAFLSTFSLCFLQVKRYLQRSSTIRRKLMLRCWHWITQLITINLHPHQACRLFQGCSGPDSPMLRRRNVRLNSPNCMSNLTTRYRHTYNRKMKPICITFLMIVVRECFHTSTFDACPGAIDIRVWFT